MTLALNNISPNPKSRTSKKRVGRGNSSGHGTYSCRGNKGQRSRTGGKSGLKLRGLRKAVKAFPKFSKLKSSTSKMAIINLKDIEDKFKEGDVVSPKEMVKVGLLKSHKKKVKVLASPFSTKKNGLKKKLTIKAHAFSKTAQEEIKKAKGETIIL
ncbi:50S ribosomal protein L15 [bacterium]|nr:50S ribosomal protein L15 [bacterium]